MMSTIVRALYSLRLLYNEQHPNLGSSGMIWNFFPSHAVSSLTAIKHGQQGGAPMSFECDDCGNIGLSLRLNPISRCFVLEENHFDYDLCFTRRAVTCHVALSCSVSVPDFKSADMVVMQISGI